jgi:glutaconate CoA-transferase subunit B
MKSPIGTPASYFNEREHQICLIARLIEDGKTYWVAGGGSPMASLLLGKTLYAPGAIYVTEDGVLAPEPKLPFDPIMTMVSSRAGYRALSWGTMNSAGFQAALGYMDYGILNTLQVDRYGNINSTALGDYDAEHRRFGGPGGADTIAAACWATILMTDQQKRKFVDRVDFISSPGFLDGSEGARERAGLPEETGPRFVVTPWAMFDYEDRHLRLMGVSPFVTVDEVLAEMSFEPRMASEIATLPTPSEEELNILRTDLDPHGQVTGEGRWISLVDGEYQLLRE